MQPQHAEVSGLYISKERHQASLPLETATIVENWGIEGHRKSRADSKRQVYLIDESMLETFDIQPGDLQENVIVRGLDVNALQPGQRLRIGDALLEVTMPCTVCGELEELRPGLKEALRGRRGILTRVLSTGVVRLGDPIQIE